MFSCSFAVHLPFAARSAAGALAAGFEGPIVPLGMGSVHRVATGEEIHRIATKVLSRHGSWACGWNRIKVHALVGERAVEIEDSPWPIFVPSKELIDFGGGKDGLGGLGLGDGLDALAAVGIEETREKERVRERER